MKLKFKIQPYQTEAVKSVVDCFVGQPLVPSVKYRIDPGKQFSLDSTGFRNTEVKLTGEHLLRNIRTVQQSHNLTLSDKLISSAGCNINLDIEMETGTGKTYCYIKTIFELHKRYGWNKYIIVVPSIAIREGVYKSLEITAEHFSETYHRKARYFIYNSKQLHNLESFSSDSGINVMVINIQAFNASGKDNRRIYDELDDFQSRKPIDVISSNRPILILDEPQKMEGKKTLEALSQFKPLMILRYSATHRTTYNLIHRLDALDAYNNKLVKKISVLGISAKGLAGTNAYLYLESIEISKSAPTIKLELEVKQQKNPIKRIVKRLKKGSDLYTESNELEQYRGYIISQIDANSNTVEFTNGKILSVGEAVGNISETDIRSIQIREAIQSHLEKERKLFKQKIKTLSLFFIDEVAKYRDYSKEDEQGEYARIFESEYSRIIDDHIKQNNADDREYISYLRSIQPRKTHNGYFSIDKKSNRLTDPKYKLRGEDAGLSDDVDAYDLILRDKERLLSFEEPTRFIFSHSALREGWDNPNVFVMCMLKQSSNTISRRQEVGRGLRLSVNQDGERMDDPSSVHDINVLTVVANESYKDFVSNLQTEMKDALVSRPRKADEQYFCGKIVKTESGLVEISEEMAKKIHRYLIKNEYVDNNDHISSVYHMAKEGATLSKLPDELDPYSAQIFNLIDSVFSDLHMQGIIDERKLNVNIRNENYEKKEFKKLWNHINQKAIYFVNFQTNELIEKSVKALVQELKVSPLQYFLQSGIQDDVITEAQLNQKKSFVLTNNKVEKHASSVYSSVVYDLIGKVCENTSLTRKTVAEILAKLPNEVFIQFKQNPEQFIAESSRIINEQKASVIIEQLTYNTVSDCYDDIDIFPLNQTSQDFSRAVGVLKKHVYDYAITDSNIESEFVNNLDVCEDVVVYAKLPRGFYIPTPVGNYNPDWAISFKEGTVKHIYFVAETKGSMSSLELRSIEEKKIECARKFFDKLNTKIDPEQVRYDVVDSFGKLMEIVK